MLRKFQCPYCGSNELYCQKYVDCREDVIIHDNGHIEYGPPIIDEDNICGVGAHFRCKQCNRRLFYTGMDVSNEEELRTYLSYSPEKAKTANDLYLDALAEQCRDDEESAEYEMTES